MAALFYFKSLENLNPGMIILKKLDDLVSIHAAKKPSFSAFISLTEKECLQLITCN